MSSTYPRRIARTRLQSPTIILPHLLRPERYLDIVRLPRSDLNRRQVRQVLLLLAVPVPRDRVCFVNIDGGFAELADGDEL